MLFPTIDFALFFAVILPVSWLLAPKPLRWKFGMLAASYFFYGWWDWRFVGLLAASTMFNHAAATALGRATDPRARRIWLTGAVAGNLVGLAYFKYYGFFLNSVANALAGIGLQPGRPLLQVILPVGISFFTFQAISYVIDVYREEIKPIDLLSFAVYLSFFPQLVAGPIVRAKEFVPQLRAPRDPRNVDTARAFSLIAAGLFKKVVVANLVATSLVDSVFTNPGLHSSPEILFGIYGYAVQIYADFSGYTDMAIGIALLLGFRFPDNFNSPYAALSLTDFWRRWHITLSSWLRDYLYIPLGGNRKGRRKTTRNLMLTMLLGGLWHGAAWTFVFWGGIHGAGMVLESAAAGKRARREEFLAKRRANSTGDGVGPSASAAEKGADPGVAVAVTVAAQAGPDRPRLRAFGQWARTFHVVCLAWVFFRAESFDTALTILWRLLTAWGPAPGVTGLYVLVIAGSIGIQFVPRELGLGLQTAFSRLSPVRMGLALGAVLLVIDALGPSGVAPFIYYQF